MSATLAVTLASVARRLHHLQPPLALNLRLQPGKHVLQSPMCCNSICWYHLLLRRHVYHRPAPAPAAASTTAPAAAAAPAAASAEPAAAPASAAAAAPAASGDPYASAASNLATGDSLKQSIDGVRRQAQSAVLRQPPCMC